MAIRNDVLSTSERGEALAVGDPLFGVIHINFTKATGVTEAASVMASTLSAGIFLDALKANNSSKELLCDQLGETAILRELLFVSQWKRRGRNVTPSVMERAIVETSLLLGSSICCMTFGQQRHRFGGARGGRERSLFYRRNILNHHFCILRCCG